MIHINQYKADTPSAFFNFIETQFPMKLKSALESAPGSGGFYPYDERMKQDKE